MVNSNLVKTHLCAECEAPLVEIWNPATSQREIKCGQNKSHVGFKSYRESKSELERKGRQMVSDNKQTALAKYSGSVALDKAEAEEVLLSLWPDAPKSEVFKAALICKQYGLNPLMKHLYLVGYNNTKSEEKTWSIQIGIGATRMIARRSGAYSYIDDTPRLMTEAEQVKIFGEVDKTKFWAITKLMSKDGMTAQAYGNWEKSKFVKGADKGNTPQNMAFIRSERAALDKLFPEKLPAGVDVFASEYQDVQMINPATGEIIEGKTESPNQLTSASPPPKMEDTTDKQAEADLGLTQAKTAQPGLDLSKQGTKVGDMATEAQLTELKRLGKLVGYRDDNQVVQAVCTKYKREEWNVLPAGEAAQFIAYLKDLAVKQKRSPTDIKTTAQSKIMPVDSGEAF